MFQGSIPHRINAFDVDGPNFMVLPFLQGMHQPCSVASVHHPAG
jgi:hypothetical protein